MKKRSKVFLIILSLFFTVITSCGIPNYFGNTSRYVIFRDNRLRLSSREFSDGFRLDTIEPKVMFLYTIYSDNAINELSTSSMLGKLSSKFKEDFKLSDYDYRGCDDVGDQPVSRYTFKDSKENEHSIGLYQLKTLEVVNAPSGVDAKPTNHSSDYLFNVENMEFMYNHDYSFTYELVEIDDNEGLGLKVSCLDEDKEVKSSYVMGNYTNDYFRVKFNAGTTQDYDYANNPNPTIWVLPVLYLESDLYNNRQMLIGDWKKLPLAYPEN